MCVCVSTVNVIENTIKLELDYNEQTEKMHTTLVVIRWSYYR